MSLLMAMLVGIAVGVIGMRMQKAGSDVAVMHFIAALAGSLIGLFIYAIVTLGSEEQSQSFSWLALVFCVLGAFAGDFAYASVQRLTVRHTEKTKDKNVEKS